MFVNLCLHFRKTPLVLFCDMSTIPVRLTEINLGTIYSENRSNAIVSHDPAVFSINFGQYKVRRFKQMYHPLFGIYKEQSEFIWHTHKLHMSNRINFVYLACATTAKLINFVC